MLVAQDLANETRERFSPHQKYHHIYEVRDKHNQIVSGSILEYNCPQLSTMMHQLKIHPKRYLHCPISQAVKFLVRTRCYEEETYGIAEALLK
jgi:hypothetical protein